MEGQDVAQGFQLEGQTLPHGFMTFDMVQDRLVEAVLLLWRMPDRERGWLRVKAMWPDILRDRMFDADGGFHPEEDPQPRIPPATRHEIAQMEEALGWMRFVGDDDRRLVGLAVRQLARGSREVRWRELLRPMGLRLGADGLRWRYGRALNAIAVGIASTDRIGS